MFLQKALVGILSLIAVASANLHFELNHVDTPKSTTDEVNYRLPNSTHPETYDISLFTRVDIGDFGFTGSVKIGIAVDHPTREIVLHARQLSIANIQLFRQNGNRFVEVKTLPYIYENVTEFLIITTYGVDLIPGDRLELDISYSGELRVVDSMGFHRLSYNGSDGQPM